MDDNITANLAEAMDEPRYWEYPEYQLSKQLYEKVSPVMFVIGTVGGILTLIVMRRKSIRTASTSVYFCGLAVVDLLVLYIGLMRYWLRVLINLDIRKLSDWSCKVHYFTLYTLTHYSAWILVAVTIERAISVTRPLKARLICTQQNALISLGVILISLLSVNSHFFWTRGERILISGNSTIVHTCKITSPNYYDFDDYVWPWIDFSLLSFIPAMIMISCNILIITTIALTRRRNLPLMGTERRVKMTSMTAMLLITNTTFLLLTAPVVTFIILDREWRKQSHSEHKEAKLYLAYSCVILISYLNNCINFLLYCIGGPRFRRELKAMLCTNRRVQPITHTLTLNQNNPTDTKPTVSSRSNDPV